MTIAIIATIVISVIIYEKSGLLSYQLSNYVNDHYLKTTNFRFSCGRLSVDLAGRASLASPVLRYNDGLQVVELFRARRIAFRFDISQVLKLRAMISDVVIERPTIVLQRNDQGDYILPRPTPAEERPASSSVAPHIDVESFALSGLTLVLKGEGERLTVTDVNLEGFLRWTENKGEIEISKGDGVIKEKEISIDSFTLKAHTEQGAVVADRIEVRTARSFAVVSGRYEAGRMHHVQAVFNPLDLAELSATGLISEEGELGGNVVVDGVPDSLMVRGSVTGRGLGLVFNGVSFEGVVTPEQIYLSNVQGGVYGARLNGDLTYRTDVGNYSFHGVCEGLDISQGFVPDGGVPKTDFNGLVTVEYDSPQKAYEFRGDLRRSTIDGFQADRMQFRIGYRETSGVRFREVTMTRPGFVVKASGLIDANDNVDMIVALEGNDITYLAEYFVLPDIDGTVDLSGRLVGPLDAFQLNLNGNWYDLAYEFVHIDTAQVTAEAKNVPSDASHATISVHGRSLRLWDRVFESPSALIEADAQKVTFQDLSFSHGDTFVTGRFEVVSDGDEQNVLVSDIRVEMPHSSWMNTHPTTLVLDAETIRVDSLVLVSDGQLVGGMGTYSAATRTCDFRAWSDNLDLTFVKEVAGWTFPLAGNGTVRGSVKGEIDDPAITVRAQLRDGVVDSLAFDYVEIEGNSGDGGYVLDRLMIASGRDSLVAEGRWDYGDSPLKVVREGFDRAKTAAAPLKVTVKCPHFELAKIFRVLREADPLGGAFEGDVYVDNTLGNPRVRLSGSLVSLPQGRFRLPNVPLDLTYENMILTIRGAEFDDGNTRASLTGTLPLNLGMGRAFGLVGSAPVALNILVESEDLSDVSEYFDEVAVSGGRLDGRISITGTSNEPHYAGTLNVQKGVLRVAGTEELYREINARLSIDRRRLVLTSLSGKEGKKGRFSGSGWAEVEGFHLDRYELQLQFTDITIASIPGLESTQNGTLKITSEKPSYATVPRIAGQLAVTQANVTLDLGNEPQAPSPLTMPTDRPSWLCNIDVDAPKNVWLRNRDLNVELGGTLIIHRDNDGLYFRGDLSPLRGSYLLYNNKFHVTGGRVDFSTGFTLRPGLSLDAYTSHRRSGEDERRIYLNLAWPPDKPEPTITLSYDVPGYSQADLWRMLGGQVAVGSAQTATGAAQNIASSYLERILNAQMRDMTIDVESVPRDDTRGVGTGQALSVALGRYLSPDLYLKYRQGISYTTEREVEVEYRVSNLVLLRSEFLRHSGGLAGSSRRQTTDEVNFDIKFRWEY